jgi:hypothetical protein
MQIILANNRFNFINKIELFPIVFFAVINSERNKIHSLDFFTSTCRQTGSVLLRGVSFEPVLSVSKYQAKKKDKNTFARLWFLGN